MTDHLQAVYEGFSIEDRNWPPYYFVKPSPCPPNDKNKYRSREHRQPMEVGLLRGGGGGGGGGAGGGLLGQRDGEETSKYNRFTYHSFP